ncbi:four helix bundle protein [candidate division KSB1 bacterium]|nr:four helix bundle protein [candidate division KSB1 bacterium]
MTYEEWIEQVPDNIKNDPLWNFEVYPKALLLFDFAWGDCDKLAQDHRGRKVSEQLIDSAGSISANIEEGYGRGYGLDYSRFLRIALGSARETRGWYYRGRKLLDQKILNYRYKLLDEIIALLATHSSRQKRRAQKGKHTSSSK